MKLQEQFITFDDAKDKKSKKMIPADSAEDDEKMARNTSYISYIYNNVIFNSREY